MTPLALLMQRKIVQVTPKTSLRDAAKLMRDKHLGSLIISEGEEMLGIVSVVDFVIKGIAENLNADHTTIETIMSSPIITIDIDQTAKEANNVMAENGIRHLCITDRDKIVGIFSMRDLVLYYKNRK